MYFILLILLALSIYVLNPAFSIFLGSLFAILFKPNEDFPIFQLKALPLQVGIVLMGFTISIDYLIDTNIHYLPWVSLFVVTSFIMAILIGSLFGVNRRLKYMLASGFAICGASAMIVIAPLIKAKPFELLACLMIFFAINMIAILAYPLLGQFLGATNQQFGLFSALAIQDTSSVIGTSIIYSQESAIIAASLKLMRTLWLIPLVIFTSAIFKHEKGSLMSTFPYFVLFFMIAVIAGSLCSLSQGFISFISYSSLVFINIGLFCVGLKFRLNNNAFKLSLLYTSIFTWVFILLSSILLISFILQPSSI